MKLFKKNNKKKNNNIVEIIDNKKYLVTYTVYQLSKGASVTLTEEVNTKELNTLKTDAMYISIRKIIEI